MSPRAILRVALISASCCLFSSSAFAVPVLVEVEGRVAQNTFTSFPFDGTPLGTRVVFSCIIDSTSGFEFTPGFRLGMSMTSMKLAFDASSSGPFLMTFDTPRSASFATVGITPAIPDSDQFEVDPITFSSGGIQLHQTLKLNDGDDVSWPTADLARLKPCGVPGSNFKNPANGDRKHWYLEGVTTIGAMDVDLIEIRQVATSAGDGDINESGFADGDDLQPFAGAVLALSDDANDVCHADFSLNGIVDPNDIPGMVDVLLTGIIPPPIPPSGGACCYVDLFGMPVCQSTVDLAACQALDGFDHQFTYARSCEDLALPCGGGACCLPDGSCQLLGLPGSTDPNGDCTTMGGFFTPGMPCDPNLCPGAPTACCLVDEFFVPIGECILATPEECSTMGGFGQLPGVACEPNVCVFACCLPGGACTELTDSDCLNAGGTFEFNQHSCEYYKCPPVNDSCATPMVVTEGSIIFDIRGATTDGDELPQFTEGCEQGLALENFIDADIWFTYSPSCTGVVQIDTCGSYDLGNSSNTTIAVYDDCEACPPSSVANLVVCNNREMSAPVQLCFGNGGAGQDAAIRFDAIAGECYKIRLGTENGTTYGIGVLNIACGGACCPPDGFLCTIESQDDCENVIGGFYGGDGSTCDFTTCPGACCHPVDNVTVCEIVRKRA